MDNVFLTHIGVINNMALDVWCLFNDNQPYTLRSTSFTLSYADFIHYWSHVVLEGVYFHIY
jgi:hypothetical protein